MLQLVLGVAGTGKTSWMLDEMSRLTENGKNCVWLVPEQFSSSAEMMVYHLLGDEKSGLVEVVSFRTLSERIFKICGSKNQKILTDAGRVVFVRRALDALGSELKTFSRHRRSTAFCNLCAETIAELKTAGATPEILRLVAEQGQDSKLGEMALIMQAYDGVLAGSAMDPEDRLLEAAQRADCGFFENKTCFIDNFDGFTSPEYALLAEILKLSLKVYVALCCDGLQETDGGMGLFSPVRKTAMRLIGKAEKAEAKVLAPVVLDTVRRAQASGPAWVENVLNGREISPGEALVEGLCYSQPPDEWQEIRSIAAEMRRLAEQGVPYSRMALVCRDIASYEAVVRREMNLFDIPYFLDASATVEYTAPIAFFRAALEILQRGIAPRPLLAMLKTGLCDYTKYEISVFENYLYTWERLDLRNPFDKNPKGLLAEMDQDAAAQLEIAEKIRRELTEKLKAFTEKCQKKTADELARQMYLLLENFGGAKNTEALAQSLEGQGAPLLAQNCRAAWDSAMELLDEIAALLAGEEVSPAEFDELFLLLVRSSDFGQVPQSLECVVFTSADRMRLADPDYCFVAGIWEGEFPKQVGYSGILTHTDREKLVERGVEMPGSFQNRTLLEEMFFYRALTAPRKALYLSCPKRHQGGAKSVSSALQPVLEALNPPPLETGLEQAAVTPKAAFDLLCSEYRDNTAQAASLQNALWERGGEWEHKVLHLLGQMENDGRFYVGDAQLLRRITGRRLTLSATRAEKYYECRFAYFMERILGIRPRRKAELSPLESGTFVHYILEKVLEEAGPRFGEKQDGWLAEAAARHADCFIADNLPDDSRRARFLLGEIKQSVAKLLCFMRDAASHSDFVVDAVELSISDEEGAVPPLEVQTQDGTTLRVTGQVDRVDVLHRGDKTYLCIIDYKTGEKKFDLQDVYCGLNMQMLIYMYTLCKNGEAEYKNALPAGVLYLTGDPAPASGRRQGGGGTVYKMDGLLLEDESVLRSMDRDATGLFVPVKFNKDGSLRAGKRFASLEKMGAIYRHVEEMLAGMAAGIYQGDFAAQPLVKGARRPCDYCSYRAACRHEYGKLEKEVAAPDNAFEPQQQEGGQADG